VRGTAKLTPLGVEARLLAFLVGAASVVVMVSELTGGGSLAGYRVLSFLFLGAVVMWTTACFTRQPPRVEVWTVLVLFTTLFFTAGGILGEDPGLGSRVRMSLAHQVLLWLALGLVGSWIGFRLFRPSSTTTANSGLRARVQATRLSVVFLAVAAVWSLRIYSASKGLVLSHAGDVMTEVGTGASIAIHLGLIVRPVILFLGAVLTTQDRPVRRVVGLLVLIGELVYAVLWARRLLLEVMIALLIVSTWSGRRLRGRQFLTWAAVVAFATVIMWPFMFHLRAVAQQAGLYGGDLAGRADTLLYDVVPEAIRTFDLGRSFEADSEYLENVRGRSRTSDLLIDIADSHHEGTPVMGGAVIRAAIVASVPRVLWPGKEQFMATETWQVEELIEEHYGLPLVDMASTVFTHGYADGGVIGAMLYMALLGATLAVGEWARTRLRCALLGLWVYALTVSLAVQVEQNVTDVFGIGRVIVVLLVVDYLAGRQLERLATVPRLRRLVGRPVWAT
jgi:hypothetical protein